MRHPLATALYSFDKKEKTQENRYEIVFKNRKYEEISTFWIL